MSGEGSLSDARRRKFRCEVCCSRAGSRWARTGEAQYSGTRPARRLREQQDAQPFANPDLPAGNRFHRNHLYLPVLDVARQRPAASQRVENPSSAV